MASTNVVTKTIGIPVRILEAKDCEPLWAELPSSSPLTARCIEFKIPSGSAPGCILKIPIQDESLDFTMPEFYAEGDTVCMRQREDKSWRIVKKTIQFSFLAQSYKPGEKARFVVPDGTPLVMEVPEGLDPGDMVTLKRDSGGFWALDQVDVLPGINEMPDHPVWANGPYPGILRLLADRGYLRGLPVDDGGTLHINIPFCGRFQEYAVLGQFLAEHCLELPQVANISICAVEVCERYYDWAIAQRWLEQHHPRIKLKACAHDLAQDPLPAAGFSLGIHPEVTKGGCWFRIIGSIVRSCCQGLCVFSTFYEVEMNTLVNMIEMYKDTNSTVDVVENPYYEEHHRPQHSPMRYVVIVQGASV